MIENLAFMFFDFCADHRVCSFFTIFAVAIGLAELAVVSLDMGIIPLSVVFGLASGGFAHIGFGSWFVTSEK